jgi:hypothetical protein
VTVSAGAGFGTPTGTVTLSVGSATGNQPKQTQTLNSAGVATFAYNALLGGTYTVNADYSGCWHSRRHPEHMFDGHPVLLRGRRKGHVHNRPGTPDYHAWCAGDEQSMFELHHFDQWNCFD